MLYDYPKYYEAAFSFRDIPAEVEFMQTCMKRFSKIRVNNLLEIGCGYAPHAGELISRDFSYVGLDINHRMLNHARTKWQQIRPTPELIQADMVDFTLESKTDFVFVMIGSLYLKSEDDLRSHFDAVGDALRSGGLYFLDWCVQFFDPEDWDERISFAVEKDGIRLESRFRIEPIPTGRSMYKETWTVDVDDHGEHHRLEMVERNLALLPGEFKAFLAGRDDFEFVGWWSDWDLDRSIEAHGEIRRPLAIVRRTDKPALGR